jgi:GT2 family glycosyltransferase
MVTEGAQRGLAVSGSALCIGASIVLYRTPIAAVRPLIEALLEQGVSHVYVIDNSPESFGAFRNWLPDERVSLMSGHGNLGYGRANNLAIRKSTGRHQYHLVCNPDISLEPGAIRALYDMMESRTEVGLCMPRVVGTDGRVQHLCKRSPVPLDYLSRLVPPRSWSQRRRARMEMLDRSYELEMDVDCLSGCFMFFRSSVLAELNGFDERFFLYFEDFDLSQRSRRVAVNLYYPGARVVHVHAREHRRSWRVRMHFIMSAIRYFNKWGWFGYP